MAIIYLKFNNITDLTEHLQDGGYPRTGFNAATGLPADKSKQVTERPYPIETAEGEYFMEIDDEEYSSRLRATEVSKEEVNIKGLFLDPIE